MTSQDQTNRLQVDTNRAQKHTNVETETRHVQNLADIKALHKELEAVRREALEKLQALDEKVASLTEDRDNALKWGVLTLGAAVVGLVGWILKLLGKTLP